MAVPTRRMSLNGFVLLIVLLLIPGGLVSVVFGVRDRMLRVLALWHGVALDVPRDQDASGSEPEQAVGAVPVPEEAVLAVRDLDVSYGQLQVLFGVDFTVADGEMVALLGTNGAGKSTLLKAMVGLVPSGGSFHVRGEARRRVRADRVVRDGIALMSGGRSTFHTLTVEEHLRLATWTFRRDHDRIEEDRARMRWCGR